MVARRLCCAGVLLLLLVIAPAAGAATWTAETMAIPETVQGQLFSVSCSVPNACEGVGQVVDAQGNTRALAEAWNGSSWRTQNVPSFDAPLTSLSAVSCSSPNACIAVGSYQGNTSGGDFAERWDGSRWTVQLLPSLAGATGLLNSVSCATASACTAVGFQFDNRTGQQLPLVEVYDGLGWRTQKSPTPAGAAGASLSSVSCTSATACTAAGSYFQATGPQLPMAESRRASSWVLTPVPVPANAIATFLNSVSCSAPNACTSVGAYITRTQEIGLAERWNGVAWTRETVPAPSGAFAVDLAGVSCTSAFSCMAVGGAASPTSSAPIAEYWNGSGWSLRPTPAEPGGFLGSVSCAVSHSCTAAGVPGAGGALAMARPRPGTLPRPGLLAGAPRISSLGSLGAARHGTPAGATGLPEAGAPPSVPGQSGVGPATGSRMYHPPAAVGQLAHAPGGGSGSLTLAEHWDGAQWTVEPTPGFTGAAVSQAIGIACGSPSSCFATGFWIDNRNGAQLALLERRNGASWSIQPIPTPASALSARLFDVSCTAANACTAVGEAFTGTTEMAFADRWDGTNWTLQSVPGQAGLGSALGSVSCTAADACTAVGALLNDHTGVLYTLAEFWDGSKWVVQPTVNKSGNTSSYFYGVSCSQTNACMAVGDYNGNASPTIGPLSELWRGTAWRLEPVPAPPNSMFNLPGPVSCSAPDACTAVGFWATQSGGGPLAVRWDGSAWTQQQVPSSLFVLNGVACATATACVAVSTGSSAIWNGLSWSVAPLAPPPVGNFPSLNDVWCSTAATDCTAVGNAFTGQPVPLAERYS